MKLDDLLKRADELIKKGQNVLSTQKHCGLGVAVDFGQLKGSRTACLSFIERIYSSSHPHYKEFDEIVKDQDPSYTEAGVEILRTIKAEIAGGWLFTVKGVIAAEIFSDFLEMAEHLLSQGYKDPAAVMIGSTLEEHLRQLCLKHNIDIEVEKNGKMIPKKADVLNAELTKRRVSETMSQTKKSLHYRQ